MAKVIGWLVAGAVGLFLLKALGFVLGIVVAAFVVPILQILVVGLCTQTAKALGFSSSEPVATKSTQVASTTSVLFGTARNEYDLYERATSEFNTDSRKAGLWEQSLSEAAGDQDVARATYLRLRMAELLDEQKVERQAAAEHEKQSLVQQERQNP